MQNFSLREFIELTGVGIGKYGIYEVTRDGVVLRSPLSDDQVDRDLAPKDQADVLKAEETLSLKFPCSPEDFQKWYDATRGTADENSKEGVSDFPLSPAFVRALVEADKVETERLGAAVPASAIMAAFSGKDREWWKSRMRSAKRYGLAGARRSSGRAQRQSYWTPVLVAEWLIRRKHLTRGVVIKALEAHFPDADTTHL